MKILALLALFACSALAGDLPDPKLTPGSVFPQITAADIARPGYAGEVRNVSVKTKKAVFELYSIPWADRSLYEVDHLISLELGGNNEITNLWPQAYASALGAHEKDRIEGRLHWLVIHGKIPLAQAQKEIAADWIKAYRTYSKQ